MRTINRPKPIPVLRLIPLLIFTFHGLAQGPVIILDPGHGGRDSGAIGTNGIQEKNVVLAIAKYLVEYNRTLLDPPYDLYLTRYGDSLISLGDRSKPSKALGAALFVSLHCNHARNPRATGLEVYLHKGPIPLKTQRVAEILDQDLQQHLGYRSRGVKRANFQVLRDHRGSCPALLLELGFLSNATESMHLEGVENLRALALAILMGIDRALEETPQP